MTVRDMNAYRQGAGAGAAPTVLPFRESEPPAVKASNRQPLLTTLADVEPQSVSWLWPSRLALGKLCLLVGDPGLGKSSVTLDLAARLSAGRAWPDGAPASAPCDVVLLGAEDGLADTVRPRLDAFGADVRRMHALQGVRDGTGDREGLSLAADLDVLEQAISETGARCVVVDPLSAYLGTGTDSHKDAEVRAVLAPMAALAERLDVAVLGVMHLSKGEQKRAIHRALGSVGFVAAARVVLGLGRDPDDEDRRLLVTVKNNLAAPAPSLAFRFGPGGRLDWEGTPASGVDVEAVLGGGQQNAEERGARQQAADFLRAELADCPVPTKELLASAEAQGISRSTLFRARGEMGIRAEKEGFGKTGRWLWSLPAPKDSRECHDAQT